MLLDNHKEIPHINQKPFLIQHLFQKIEHMAYRVKNKIRKNDPHSYQLITSSSALENCLKKIEKEKTVAVDLEADSMFHFKEKVCLIQIATKKLNLIIDPLEIEDISILAPLFSNPNIRKIFHGSDYDIRSLHRDFRFEINNLFDTEIASRFLGVRESGLDAVLRQRLNVALDKKYQKKDWSQRPLPESMMEYASRDAIFLLPLSRMLEKELKQKGRLDWVTEECELLSNVRYMSPNGEPLFTKFKGAGRLDSISLAVLEALLIMRQNIAKRKDRPLFKVISNRAIKRMATEQPKTLTRLKKSGILSHNQINMYGADCIYTIKKALKTPKRHLPAYPRKAKSKTVSPAVPGRIKALKAWRDQTAERLDIDPALLANKALMTSIAIKNPSSLKHLRQVDAIKNWQVNTFGKDIINVLKSGKKQGTLR